MKTAVAASLFSVSIQVAADFFVEQIQLSGELIADRELHPSRFHVGKIPSALRVSLPFSQPSRLFGPLVAIRHVMLCLLQHARLSFFFVLETSFSKSDTVVCLLQDLSRNLTLGC